ncbi:MAG: EamA family transporter [Spirochaetaceae bacterium]
MTKKSLLIIFCYLAIYLIWGTTYYFIAKAVETIPPSVVVSFRFLVGGLVIFLIPILSGKIKRLPTKQEVGTSIFLGFFLLIMGNGIVTFAEQTIDSYIASLIISTVPLIIALMNMIIFRTKLNYKQILGFFIGFTGVAFLLYNDTPRDPAEFQGILLLFLAIFCWGFGTVWSKKLTHHYDTFFSTGMQMIFAGIIAFIVTIIQGEDLNLILNNSSQLSMFSVLFLTFVGGSAIGAYNYLLKNQPTGRISSYALVNPLIATIVGLYIGGEQPAKYLWIGIILILTGLVFMLYLARVKKPKL